jgi:hypothetical protein
MFKIQELENVKSGNPQANQAQAVGTEFCRPISLGWLGLAWPRGLGLG